MTSRLLRQLLRTLPYQADRDLYKNEMQEILLNYPNLRLVEASVEDIIFDDSEKLKGIKIQDGMLNIARIAGNGTT